MKSEILKARVEFTKIFSFACTCVLTRMRAVICHYVTTFGWKAESIYIYIYIKGGISDMNKEVYITVVRIPVTFAKIIQFFFRCVKSHCFSRWAWYPPVFRLTSEGMSRQKSGRISDRQNQDIRTVDNPPDLFWHYFFAKPPHVREPP